MVKLQKEQQAFRGNGRALGTGATECHDEAMIEGGWWVRQGADVTGGRPATRLPRPDYIGARNDENTLTED
jgi:hypothetical protein